MCSLHKQEEAQCDCGWYLSVYKYDLLFRLTSFCLLCFKSKISFQSKFLQALYFTDLFLTEPKKTIQFGSQTSNFFFFIALQNSKVLNKRFGLNPWLNQKKMFIYIKLNEWKEIYNKQYTLSHTSGVVISLPQKFFFQVLSAACHAIKAYCACAYGVLKYPFLIKPDEILMKTMDFFLLCQLDLHRDIFGTNITWPKIFQWSSV